MKKKDKNSKKNWRKQMKKALISQAESRTDFCESTSFPLTSEPTINFKISTTWLF